MKMISAFVLLTSIECYASQMPTIDSLEFKKQSFATVVKIYSDSIKEISKLIEKEKIKQLQKKEHITGVLKWSTTVKRTSAIGAQPLGTFNKGDTVYLYSTKEYHYLASNGDLMGYIPAGSIQETEENLLFYKVMRQAEVAENEARIKKENDEMFARQKADKEATAAKRKSIIQNKFSKYGRDVVDKIYNRYYWVGMTAEMAKYSLGEPSKINSSVGSWGKKEQWVYTNSYLYFENGILTSYQTSD